MRIVDSSDDKDNLEAAQPETDYTAGRDVSRMFGNVVLAIFGIGVILAVSTFTVLAYKGFIWAINL